MLLTLRLTSSVSVTEEQPADTFRQNVRESLTLTKKFFELEIETAKRSNRLSKTAN